MGNVLIVGWNRSFNYGTNLQAIALADVVGKRHNVSLLWQKRMLSPKEFFKKLFATRHFERDYFSKELWNSIVAQYNCYNKVTCNNKRERDNILRNYSTILVGSDQLWNPYFLDETMLLNFLPNTCNKVSYATSVGVNVLTESANAKYKQYLDGFNYISVREKASAEQLTEILHKPVEMTLDPVFLKTKEEWHTFAKSSTICNNLPKKYLLCYFVGNNNYLPRASEIAKQTALPIVVVPMKKTDLWSNAKIVDSANVTDFVSLVENATTICTDSFHLSAMSLIFNKDFFLLQRFSNLSAQPTIRTDNLLQTFGVELDCDHALYNIESVNQIIATEREHSLNKLFSHLK